MTYQIRRNAYFVEIKSEERKERFSLRLLSKKLECYECGDMIKRGDKYIRDKFWYYNYDDKTIIKCNFICLNCWKGEVPKFISTNWRRNR